MILFQSFPSKVRFADADLREHGAGPGGEGHLLVLLRQVGKPQQKNFI